MNDRMTNVEIEVHACVRVEAHDVDIFYSLIFPCLVV